MAAHCLSMDDETNRRLNELVEMSSTTTTRSKVIAELIDKEYVLRKELQDAV